MVFARYLLAPLMFLTIALLGGLRVGAADSAFIFVAPPLICLLLGTMLFVLLTQTGIFNYQNLFSVNNDLTANIGGFALGSALFAACVQIFNLVLPEKGLLFWLIAFFFFWTLWSNLFAEFTLKKLLINLFGLFGMAFFVKYVFLASVNAPKEKSLTDKIVETFLKGVSLNIFSAPSYDESTGYIAFFTLFMFALSLLLLAAINEKKALLQNAEEAPGAEIIGRL